MLVWDVSVQLPPCLPCAVVVVGTGQSTTTKAFPLQAQRYRPCGLEVMGEVAGGQPGGGGGGGVQRGGVLWRQARDPEAQAAALGLLPPGLLHEMGNR